MEIGALTLTHDCQMLFARRRVSATSWTVVCYPMTVMVQCSAIFVHTDVQFLAPPTLGEHLAAVTTVPAKAAIFLF